MQRARAVSTAVAMAHLAMEMKTNPEQLFISMKERKQRGKEVRAQCAED